MHDPLVPLLEMRSVSKTYEALEEITAAPVLSDVHLQIMPAETVAIMGPSGSGKSTLLNIIGTLDQPSGGTVILNGTDTANLNEKELAKMRCRTVGMVFQLHHLLPQCSVMENVLVPTLAADGIIRREPAVERAKRLLARVGLSHRLDHRPGQLSGGERQRTALVRALINEPCLLLADEPTGAIDRPSADSLADLLLELNREEGVALLVSTHAKSMADRMSRCYAIIDGCLELQ